MSRLRQRSGCERRSAGRELHVGVAATDDDGEEQALAPVGSVAVTDGTTSSADSDGCQVAGGRGDASRWPLLATLALGLVGAAARRGR